MFQIPIRKQTPRLLKSIIALGNPIIDISAEIEESDLLSYNLRKGGVIYATNENKGFYSVIENKVRTTYAPGGSAQNILRSISWGLNYSNIDENNQIKLSMLGCVGSDIFSNKIVNCLRQSRIRTLLEQITNMDTSRCAVGICNGDRYFLSEILASGNLSTKFVDNNWNEIISHDALLIEGYFLRENFNLCKRICELFSNAGKYIILTLGDSFMLEKYKNEITTIAKMADMIVGNRISAHVFVGVNNDLKIDDLFNRMYSLLNINKDRILIVTVGNNGVYCSKYDSATRNEIHFQTFPDKIKPNEIVDFNGAGDAFLGGFLSQQMLNKTFEDCCHLGNKVAADSIKIVGCNFPNYIRN